MEETIELGKAAEQTREIGALLQLLKRQRKKNKPIEATLEALNKLGSRRPPKQRFTIHIDKDQAKIILFTLHEEAALPAVLLHYADEVICKTTKVKLK